MRWRGRYEASLTEMVGKFREKPSFNNGYKMAINNDDEYQIDK